MAPTADELRAAGLTLADCEAFERLAKLRGFELACWYDPHRAAHTAKLSGQCILMVSRPTLFGALQALMVLWAPWAMWPPSGVAAAASAAPEAP